MYRILISTIDQGPPSFNSYLKDSNPHRNWRSQFLQCS